jgi:hypothetical protein
VSLTGSRHADASAKRHDNVGLFHAV